MTLKRWRMLVATKIVLAAGMAGEASAQQGVLPAPLPASGQACAPRRAPTFTLWNHTKARFEHWYTCVQPDAPPLGQSLYQAMTTQIDNGVAVRMILNDFDF